MTRIISGIQPSGTPSIGNFIGALKPQVSMQNEVDATFFIADLHAITVRQDPKSLREKTYGVAAWYLACGLDPKKATLFVQSHVRAHTEMGWILNTFSQMGELERMTQFKDKSKRHSQNINVGLFAYPVLQAADILLHQIDEVPVGEDQVQHIELTRDIAQRFNNHYTPEGSGAKPVFTLPKAVLPKVGARLKDLQDPTAKMSKSAEGKGTIHLTDDMSVVAKKIKSAVTDSEGIIAFDREKKAGVSNLLEIYASLENLSIEAAVKHFENQQYGTFKTAVADCLVAHLSPIQNRYNELMGDKAELEKILKIGAEKASIIAERTLQNAKKKIGFVL